jgi:hypothetical protein
VPPALAILWCGRSAAYQPFDGTDASVADLDHVAVELGSVEYVRSIGQRMLFAPDLTLCQTNPKSGASPKSGSDPDLRHFYDRHRYPTKVRYRR